MATSERRPIGPAKVGAQAPAAEVTAVPLKAEDVVTPAPDPAAPAPAESAPANPDNVAPVDTESPEYKAGYELGVAKIDTSSSDFRAGYAAGLGAGGGSEPAEAAPPAEPTVPESAAAKPATATALLAAFPDDKPFCMDCLAENLTLSAAHAKAVEHLQTQLTAERTARTAAEQKLAAETGSPPPVRVAKNTAAPAADAAAPDDPKVTAAAEWDADPSLRSKFTKKENFVAIRAAELSGQFRQLKAV